MDHLAVSVVRYYAALRLGAGAATMWLPSEFRPERPAIVRSSVSERPDGFDRREVVVHSDQTFVVTIDAGHAADRRPSTFFLN